MNECKFTPEIIGHDFNNTGLPKKYAPAKNIDAATSVEKRCQQWDKLKNEKKNQRLQQKEEEFEEKHTFKPKLTQTYHRPKSALEKEEIHDSFIRRCSNWQNDKENRLTQSRLDVQKRASVDETFHPKVNKMSQIIHNKKIDIIQSELQDLSQYPRELQVQAYYNMVRQNSKASLLKASSSASHVAPFQLREVLSTSENQCHTLYGQYSHERIHETDQSVDETLRIFDEQKIATTAAQKRRAPKNQRNSILIQNIKQQKSQREQTHEELVCCAREALMSERDHKTKQALYKNQMLRELYPSEASQVSVPASNGQFETPRVDVS